MDNERMSLLPSKQFLSQSSFIYQQPPTEHCSWANHCKKWVYLPSFINLIVRIPITEIYKKKYSKTNKNKAKMQFNVDRFRMFPELFKFTILVRVGELAILIPTMNR